MNRLHRWYCRSGHWRNVVRDLFAWTVEDIPLGDDLLELGPGPGATTALLARVTRQVTTIDIDEGGRGIGPVRPPNVRHVRGDAVRLPFATGRFSSVAAFTMLHHVNGASLQRQLIHEVGRVLQPGGMFIGCDVRPSLSMRFAHLGGTFAPVPSSRLSDDLRAAGFGRVAVAERHRYIRWCARRSAN